MIGEVRRLTFLAVLMATTTASMSLIAQGRGQLVPSMYITRINEVLADYAAGNDRAVDTWLRTRDGQQGVAFLERVFAPPAAFSRPKAAFLLEVAVWMQGVNPRKIAALNLGRRMFLGRPEPLGVNADDDRFEILWHQAALGLLQDNDSPWQQQEYLDGLDMRLEDAARRNVKLETRFPLARAIAAGNICCRPVSRNVYVDEQPSTRPRPTFESAVALYTRAAAEPPLRDEAMIRGAALQLLTERPAPALEWLDRAAGKQDDQLLHYAQSFIRARALDLLGRPDEAVNAYQAAREDAPSAQIPAIGLAAALLRAGRADEGVRVAAQARQLPADAPDVWLQFQKADSRFVKGWLEEIRRMRK
jgi:tetratricopeptide (TPR) repeat protein